MTTQTKVLHSGDFIYAASDTEYQATNAHGITFIGGQLGATNDVLRLAGGRDSLAIVNVHGLQVVDGANSMHLTLMRSDAITITEMQWRPHARIDLYGSGFQSDADMRAHLLVSEGRGGGGTTLMSPTGGCEILFQGDTTVKPNQLVFHS